MYMAFQGVGPLRTFPSRALTGWVFKRAVFISVRDEASLKRLQQWRLRTAPVLTFDPVFSLFAFRQSPSPGKRILVIIPRENSGEEFLVAVSGKLAIPWEAVRILLLKPSKEEYRVARQIQSMMKVSSQIVEIDSVGKLLDEIGSAREVVTQRYHGALAALALNVSVTIVPQGTGDKLQELQRIQSSASRNELLERVSIGTRQLRDALRN
jgi:polysaccharide pyruvyl transferase WcaK-like protein